MEGGDGSPLLVVAGILAFAIGLAHSWLGERYILVRLFRRDNLPRLFGSDWFTKRTLRFAWHMTTVAFWGFGLILLAFATERGIPDRISALRIISLTFAVIAVIAAAASRGRHLSWPVFLAIAVLSWLAAG